MSFVNTNLALFSHRITLWDIIIVAPCYTMKQRVSFTDTPQIDSNVILLLAGVCFGMTNKPWLFVELFIVLCIPVA